jgi:(p)ppGpp synthase/HD superfamily hydrolase
MDATITQLQNAIQIALTAHGLQQDKVGDLYLLHPLHVMLQMTTNEERIVAVLHDVLEDTELTVVGLAWASIPERCKDAIIAITHLKEESNIEYWARVARNPLALKVKLKDIEHNMSEARLARLPAQERTRLTDKYMVASLFLLSAEAHFATIG